MSDITISKDADALICLIYKHYLELRGNGVSKSKAKYLGSSKNINKTIKWCFDDVEEACKELHKNSLLDISGYDNICAIVYLSDAGIVYMENRFHNKIKAVLDYIDKVKFW